MVGANWYHHKELERGDRRFLGCEEEMSPARRPASGPIRSIRDRRALLRRLFQTRRSSSRISSAHQPVRPRAYPLHRTPMRYDCAAAARHRPAGDRRSDPVHPVTRLDRLDEFLRSAGAPIHSPIWLRLRASSRSAPTTATALAWRTITTARSMVIWSFRDTRRFTIFGEAGYELSDASTCMSRACTTGARRRRMARASCSSTSSGHGDGIVRRRSIFLRGRLLRRG